MLKTINFEINNSPLRKRIRPDDPGTAEGNQANDEGYSRGYEDADKAIKEMERKLG